MTTSCCQSTSTCVRMFKNGQNSRHRLSWDCHHIAFLFSLCCHEVSDGCMTMNDWCMRFIARGTELKHEHGWNNDSSTLPHHKPDYIDILWRICNFGNHFQSWLLQPTFQFKLQVWSLIVKGHVAISILLLGTMRVLSSPAGSVSVNLRSTWWLIIAIAMYCSRWNI